MNTRALHEYLVLAACAGVLLVAIFPSLQHARREFRDGLQREAVVNVKRELEDINNKKGYYPAIFSHQPYEYHVVTKDGIKALGWYVRGVVENPHASGFGFDAEEGHNFYYRYVQNGSVVYFDICGGDYLCTSL